MTDREKRVLLTPEEAESLLREGEYIHAMANPGAGMFIGADWSRESVIEALKTAVEIEIGGPACRRMEHPLVVYQSSGSGRPMFFEADMAKVNAMDAAKRAEVKS